MNYRRPQLTAGASAYNKTPNSKQPPAISSISAEHQQSIDFFTNNHFSRSFNSLILEDDVKPTASGSSQPKLNKSPPFNVKDNYYNNDNIDEYLSDIEDDETANNTKADDTMDEDYSINPNFSMTRPKLETSIKRSSKFLNLSIDSNINSHKVSNESTPYKTPVHDKLTFELNNSTPKHSNESTPSSSLRNKFKRPHQLISKSPSPHVSLTSEKSAPAQSSSRLFNFHTASSTKLRKTENSPPMKFEYYNIDQIAIDDSDLPSKNRKSSNGSNHPYPHVYSNLQVYHDENVPTPQKSGNYIRDKFNDKENTEKRSYQFVKPLQAAFKSAGLVKKSSVVAQNTKVPPETPIKRPPVMLLSEKKPNFYENENSSEMSIEVGRNHHNNSHNDSTISLFKINDDHSASTENKENNVNIKDFEYIMDDNFLQTPTKSVKKSQSTPANFSPLAIKNLDFPMTPMVKKQKSSQFKQDNRKTVEFEDELMNFKDQLRDRSTIDEHLNKKFGKSNIKYLSKGEFSIAFECNFDSQKFAIKRSKKPIIGKLEIKNILREVEALRNLTSVKDNESINLKEQEEGKEYLVYFIEAWEFNNYYYIMTEFCEGGTLFNFLQDNKNYKIDEFRIWKILIEILNGLKFIHQKNYLHLDLKPANVFITFEGSLKIGDFGLATKLPILENDFDLEGDRNYIAPELINDKIYTPFADIFSVGLIILEIATNIVLPDNGTPWRKLRSGDLSDAGKLSSDNISDFLNNRNFSSLTSLNFSSNSIHLQPPHHVTQSTTGPSEDQLTLSQIKDLIPPNAPKFLLNNSNNLDKLVNKMLQPNPFDRLTATKILEMEECVCIDNIRKAGATIYEGEFGPINDDDDE